MMRPYYPVSRIARKQYRGQAAMLRLLAALVFGAVLAIAMFASGSARAQANDLIARFDGGIGSQPLRAAGAVNTVFTTPPGGTPWVIERLTASVTTNRVRADGRGLLLAGGNNVGETGGQSVRVRLYCNGLPFDSTELVPLEENGDFRIDSGFVENPPTPCVNPRLLIINANGSWFAAGIPKR